MKLKKILITFLSVLLVISIAGAITAFAVSSSKNKIKLTSPSDGQVVSILDSSILNYYNALTEEDEIKALLENENSDKGAKGVTLSWSSNKSSFYTVKVADNINFDNAYEVNVFGFTPTIELYNLNPNTTYYWTVTGTYSNDTSNVGKFITEDAPVKMMHIDNVSNVRDLGGYEVETGTINYDLIYRGGRLNLSSSGVKISEEGQATMSNQLGIKLELDLRSSSDDDGQTTSEIPNAKYVKAPLGQYTSILSSEVYESLKDEEDLQAPNKGKVPKDWISSESKFRWGNYNATLKTTIKSIFELLADKDNYPIYIHCNAGADRTGTISMLISAVLGVDESTLIKDFELTTYSSYGRRLRDALNSEQTAFIDNDGVMQNSTSNFVAMGALLKALKENYTVDGQGTINEGVYNFLTSYVGVSSTTIENIRKIMIKDYTPTYENITLSTRQEILLTNATKSIDIEEAGVTLVTISKITIGENSLGVDLSNLDFTNASKYVFGEKDIEVVGSDATGKQYKIIVPTLIVTKEIGDADSLQAVIEYSANNQENYGYYRLINDINYSGKYCQYSENTGSNLGKYGFKGVLDGVNYTITTGAFEWNGGMFGMIGAGAVIKNVNISAVYNGKQGAIFGYTIAGATFENVTFNITGSGASETSSNTGLFTKFQCVDTTFKDVTINAQGLVIDSILGHGPYYGYLTEKPCTFDNFIVNANNVLALSLNIKTGQTISIYSVSEIGGNISDVSKSSSSAYLLNQSSYIIFDDRFENAKINSVKYQDKELKNYVLVNGMIKFKTEDLFNELDIGDRTIVVDLTLNKLNVKLTVPVEVSSNMEVVDFVNTQDLILSDEQVKLSLKEENKDYSAYTTIFFIKYGDYDLGTSIDDLNVQEIKSNLLLHGENKTIDVLATDGENLAFIHIPATIVTASINDFNTLKQCVMATEDGKDVTKNAGAYYILGEDITLTDENNQAWYYIDNGGNTVIANQIWQLTAGFAGTLDGRNYKISGIDYSKMSGSPNWTHSYGLFGSLTNATIKNITFDNVIMGIENDMHSVLAMNSNQSVIENVTINIIKSTVKSGARANIVIAKQTKATSFNNLVVNAKGFVFTTIVGEGYWSGTYGDNTYSDCEMTCGGLTYIGGQSSSSPLAEVEGFTVYIEEEIDFTNTQSIIMTDETKKLSLKETGKDYSLMTVNSISCDGVDLGTDINNLQNLDDISSHGNNTIVVSGKLGNKTTTINIPVILITQVIKDFNTLKQCVMATEDGENITKNAGAYFVLGNDITLENEDTQVWYYTDKGGNTIKANQIWNETSGFAGTLDGCNYTISGMDFTKIEEVAPNTHSHGLFGSLLNATIKNITFDKVIAHTTNSAFATLALNAYSTTFENVTINIEDAVTSTSSNNNLLIAKQTKNCSFKNLVINANDFTFTTIVGDGYWSGTYGNNKYTDCTMSCTSLTYIGGNENQSPLAKVEGFTIKVKDKPTSVNIASYATFTGTGSTSGCFDGIGKLADGIKHTTLPWDNTSYGKMAAFEVTLDFNHVTTFTAINVNGLISTGSGVNVANTISISYSNDNETYYSLSDLLIVKNTDTQYTATGDFNNQARYIKLSFVPTSGWVIIDEIEVYGIAYTITFKNADGSIISESKVVAGKTPICEVGATNTKSGWINVITGWDKEIVPATKDATYIAKIDTFKTVRSKDIDLIAQPSSYSGSPGDGSKEGFLTDGIISDTSYPSATKSERLALNGTGKEFIFDFGEATSWNEIKVHFTIGWVFNLPAKIEVFSSNNNSVWTSVGTLDIGKLGGLENKYWCEKLFNTISSRYIKLVIDGTNTSDGTYFIIDEVEIYKATNDKKITAITATTTTTDFAYAKNSPNVLFDGVVSNKDNIPDWGYSGVVFANNKTTEVIIDLGATYKVNDLSIHGICSDAGVRIPQSLKLEYSADGETYSTATVSGDYYNESTGAKLISWEAPNMTYYSKLTISSFTGRYVKLTIENNGAFSLDEVEFYGEKI